jgi:hypothetical protein
MPGPVEGLSLNIIRTSDDKLLLEYQQGDPVRKVMVKYMTTHNDTASLLKKLEQVMASTGLVV